MAVLSQYGGESTAPNFEEGLKEIEKIALENLAALAVGIHKGDIATAIAAGGALNECLTGISATAALIENEALVQELISKIEELESQIEQDTTLELGATAPRWNIKDISTEEHLQLSRDIRKLGDFIFSIRWDRLESALEVKRLLRGARSLSAINVMSSVQIALAGIDRLEVRGRDSAGIQIQLYGGNLVSPQLHTYKVAEEIGKLGDNTQELKRQILADEKLFETLQAHAHSPQADVDSLRPTLQAGVLAHTRWASIGLISLANAHPLDSNQYGEDGMALVSAVVNGDVDNYQDLIERHDLSIPTNITTDSKVVPTLIARNFKSTKNLQEAYRKTVLDFEGSSAIVALSTSDPEQMHLSLSGSGQALYIGLRKDTFIVASEPYGIVAETDRYLRMDDEIVHLSALGAGTLEGISRFSRDGKSLPPKLEEILHTEISTKDIARGDHPHFFIKEIYEAPDSVRKTFSGRITKSSTDGSYAVDLGAKAMSKAVLDRLTSSKLERIFVIGQGTAGVAARAVADAIKTQIAQHGLTNRAPIVVESVLSSELSSATINVSRDMSENQDMSDALVVAVSQSGTTTDTNRTVDLVRSRGAVVLSIVNRRDSDLTDRSDGILYTSDGRDVEMSVASTKAFYSQAVAGILLACAISDIVSTSEVASTSTEKRQNNPSLQKLLLALMSLPQAMSEVLTLRPAIAEIAERLAPSRRWWAVVGSGRDRIAAEEVRIKLSELCYKSIADDFIEDKKHIDLSSEPMILVCAGGLTGAVAQDMTKEVAIYRSHKAAPVVFAETKTAQTLDGTDTLALPTIDNRVAFILSALAGHLFSYEAALAIDSGAIPMRETRALIETAIQERGENQLGDGELEDRQPEEAEDLLEYLRPLISPHGQSFEENLRKGEYNGHLQVSTANRLATLYRYASGVLDLKSYQLDFGNMGTPVQVLEDLTLELGRAIDELSRPVDAIRHQAKTVTVGISRSDEAFLDVPLVAEVLAAGSPRDQLSYETLKTLAGLSPVVKNIAGYIRYQIQGDNLTILDRGGEAAQFESRVEKTPYLLGTKHRVTTEQKVLITRGRMDGRTVIIVPEVKNAVPVGLTLLHINAQEYLSTPVAAKVMKDYKGRYEILRDAVMETEPSFDESLLGEIPILDLLDQPIVYLADKWSTDRGAHRANKNERAERGKQDERK